jgi:capsular polysaccharide export protein
MASATVNAAGGGANVVYAVGLSRRKCSIVKRFLGDAVLHSIRDVCMAPATATVAVWGNGVADPGCFRGATCSASKTDSCVR